MTAPLVEARAARIDRDGATAIEGLSLCVDGSSLVVAGDAAPLLAALAGQAEVRAGSLRVRGVAVGAPGHAAVVGLAPLDPPLPGTMTLRAYLRAGAELAGLAPAAARAASDATLAEIGLASHAAAPLERLALPERRAAVIAQSVVASPEVLVAALPLAGLEGAGAELVARALGAATRTRAWIASVARLDTGSPEHALAARAARLLVLASGHVVRDGTLDALERHVAGWSLTVHGRADELAAALASRGAFVRGGAGRLWVEPPDGLGTAELLALSVELGAPIVELAPRLIAATPRVLEGSAT